MTEYVELKLGFEKDIRPAENWNAVKIYILN